MLSGLPLIDRPRMTRLILKRGSASRSSGQWRDDDYDVLENGVVVGRIFFLDAVGPQGRPLGAVCRRHTATFRDRRVKATHEETTHKKSRRATMGDDDRDAMREMQAHPEEIARNFRSALHHLMRAVSSQSENTTALLEARASWRFMLEGMADCKEPLDWRDIFTQAVKGFSETDHKGDEVDEAFREVARTGMSVYIDDMGAGGFGRNKFSRFMEAIRRLEEARKRSEAKRSGGPNGRR
jgi:hypothetical protein